MTNSEARKRRHEQQALLTASMELFPRLGAREVEVRFSEPDEGTSGPVVWMAIATFSGGPFGNALPPQVAAALAPEKAAFRLLEQLVDGGQCRHCNRPTGISDKFMQMPAAEAVCWYQFDPELTRFRRGCE